jgi:hypothetical protein
MVRASTIFGILSFSTWAEGRPVRQASAPAIIDNLMPAFYNGYLYSSAPRNSLTVFAPDGNVVLSLVVQGHGGDRLEVLAVPAHLSFGEDHLLWSMGWQRDADKSFKPDKLDYSTTRKYSIDGKEAGAYLPLSLFHRGLEP